MSGGRDWHEWYEAYDDPGSSLSRRLEVVRTRLAGALEARSTALPGRTIRLVSLCAGDGRDTLPVLADRRDLPVQSLLVELDRTLAQAARARAADLALGNVVVRTADAGHTGSFVDQCPADVLMLCGVLGNLEDSDVLRTIAALPGLLARDGLVIWTRGHRSGVPEDPAGVPGDPSEWVRSRFRAAGFTEADFVRPSDAGFRVGVHRLAIPPGTTPSGRLFDFVPERT